MAEASSPLGTTFIQFSGFGDEMCLRFTAEACPMRARLSRITGLTAAGLLITVSALTAQSGQYSKIAEIKIGGSGSHDYLAVEPTLRRLVVSNSTQMVVIDIDQNTVVGTIADTPRVHGIAFVPGGKGFTSNGGENKANIVDLKTLQTSSKVDIGPGP